MKRFLTAAALLLVLAVGASAQSITPGGGVGGSGTVTGVSSDCSGSGSGVIPIICTKTNGVAYAPSATTDTTNAANIGSGTLPAGRLPALTGDITTSAGSAATTLTTSGVTAGSYTAANITVDAKGRVTVAANGSGGGSGTVSAGTSGQPAVYTGSTTVGSEAAILTTQGGTGSTTGSGYALWQVHNPASLTMLNFGDSITLGTGATTNALGYAGLLQTDSNTAQTNEGTSGAYACDVDATQIFNDNVSTITIPVSRNPLQTLMIGTNDANIKGVGSYETGVYKPCHQASIAWLTIPSTNKTLASTCTQTGTWAADGNYAATLAVKSSTNSSTLSCSITTNGGPIYIWYAVNDAYTGTFTYALDGGSTTSLSSVSTPLVAALGTNGVFLVRLTSVSAASHTVAFNVTSGTGGTNTVSIIGIGTTPPATPQYFGAPAVYVAGVIQQQSNANAAATAAYNADALADVNLLAGDGLPVYFVDARSAVNSSTQMANTLHPNNAGHSAIRDAFESQIQFTPGFSGIMNSAPLAQNNPTAANYNYYLITGYQASGTGLTSTTQLMPGVLTYRNTGLGYYAGTDTGYSGTQYEARLFGTTGIFGATLSHCAVNNTSQAGCTDDLWTDTTNYNVHVRGSLGIGMTPVNPIDVTLTQATNSYISLTNAGSGATTAAYFRGFNGTDNSFFGVNGTAYTTSGLLTAHTAIAYGSAGLALIGAGGPVCIAANGTSKSLCVNAALSNSLPVYTDGSGNLTSTAPTGYSAVLSGTTGSIGGSALLAGACAAGTVTVTGATTSMVATASPSTDPDSTLTTGVAIYAFVSSSNTVTVRICAIVAVTPAASTYNVRVLQ